MNPESKLLLPRVTCKIKAQMVLGLESQALCIAAFGSSFGEQVGLDGSEFWEWGVFWSVWAFVFDMLCVRVTSKGKVGYGIVTVGIIGGKVSKLKPRVDKLN